MGQFGKNVTLTPTKTLPKKMYFFFVNFQITLSIYKLDFQNVFFFYKIGPLKKKPHCTLCTYDEASFLLMAKIIYPNIY